MILGKKMSKSKFLFGLGYAILFVALFLEDMAFSFDTSLWARGLKLLSACVVLFGSISKTWKKQFFKEFMLGILIGIVILMCTGDFFFLIVILLGFNSSKINDETIFSLAFYCCLIMLLITLVMYGGGVLPDRLSYRTDFSFEARHSFGFVHSSAMPLAIFYMFTYYIAKNKEKTKLFIAMCFTIGEIIIYQFCKSRNAVIGTCLIAFLLLIIKNNLIGIRMNKIFRIISRWIAVICAGFSFIPGLFRYKGIFMPIWYAFDVIFTNRSLLTASAIQGYGIHLINTMSYSEYSSVGVTVDSYIHNGLVLDSAYTYILIRYGILIFLFFYIMLLSFYKKEKENVYMCIIYIVIVLINITDNDMLSYGCLPFLLIGIKNIWNKRTKRRKLKI